MLSCSRSTTTRTTWRSQWPSTTLPCTNTHSTNRPPNLHRHRAWPAARPLARFTKCSRCRITNGRWSITIQTAIRTTRSVLSTIQAKSCTSAPIPIHHAQTSRTQQTSLAATRRSHLGHYTHRMTSMVPTISTTNTSKNKHMASQSPVQTTLRLHHLQSAHPPASHLPIALLARHPPRRHHPARPHRLFADESLLSMARLPKPSLRRCRTAREKTQLQRRRSAEDVAHFDLTNASKHTRSASCEHAYGVSF